jgi:pyridoxamine 5'-phosphate oxidase
VDDVEARRERARERGLTEADLDRDPIVQFDRWFAEVSELAPFDAVAVALATAAADGAPSVRYVLLKGVDEAGFTFFTHYDSPKGRDLEGDARAALVFGWHALARQVRVSGVVERVSPAESDDYWRTRPRGSQLGAWASPQSQVIPDRRVLEDSVAELAGRFAEGDVPRPANWGGYRLVPGWVEFWQSRADRLHDRLRYSRDGSGWRIERLAP